MSSQMIFVASSSELKLERMELVDLMQDMTEKSSTDIYRPILWEFMDASMRGTRKEDDYLLKLRQCEQCLVIFWRTLGLYTVEELEVAIAEQAAGHMPKHVHILYKLPCDDQTLALKEHKLHFASQYPDFNIHHFSSTAELRSIVRKLLTATH